MAQIMKPEPDAVIKAPLKVEVHDPMVSQLTRIANALEYLAEAESIKARDNGLPPFKK